MTRRGLLGQLSNGERFLVDKDEFVIGRARACDLWIPKGNLSKRQCAIVRRDRRWFVVDLRSTSGTLVDGRRIPGPTALAAGARIRFGDEVIVVVDLDHEARSGELTAPLDRRLELSCPPLVCRARVSLASMTGSAALDAEVDDMLRATGAVAEGTSLRFADPIALVLAIQQLHQHGEEQRGLHRRVCGIELRVSQHDLVFGQAALDLLGESTVPSLAAWRWLTRHDRARVPPSLLRGLALDLQRPADSGFRQELVAAMEVRTAGVCLWLTTATDGYLVWIDRAITLGTADGEVVVRGWQDTHLAIEPTPTGWRARGEVKSLTTTALIDEPLIAGTRLDLDHCRLDVVAIYDI